MSVFSVPTVHACLLKDIWYILSMSLACRIRNTNRSLTFIINIPHSHSQLDIHGEDVLTEHLNIATYILTQLLLSKVCYTMI